MSQVSGFAQDLINKVSSVAALTGKVGTGGGTELDPLMLQAPAPFAIITFSGDEPMDQTPDGRRFQQIKSVFFVSIHQDLVPENLQSTTWPLLEAVAASVRGKVGTGTNLIWKYEGQRLKFQDSGRIMYEQIYSIIDLRTIL